MPTKIKLDKIESKNKKFTVDALELTVEDNEVKNADRAFEKIKESVAVIDSLAIELDEVKKKLDSVTAERDHSTEQAEKLGKELEEAKNTDSESMRQAVKDRIKLETIAAYVGIEEKERNCDSKELKIKIIKAKSEKFDAEGKSDEHINVRYDILREELEKEANGNLDIMKMMKDSVPTNNNNDDDKNISPRDGYIKKCNETFKN